MWIDNKRNLEFYIIETIRKIDKLDNYINELLSKHYPTGTPSSFLLLIKKSATFIKSDIVKILTIIQNFSEGYEIIHYHRQILGLEEMIKMLWSHLKFVDGAQTHKVPWSIVPSIEKLLQDITNDPGKKILFRPQWNYNFSVQPQDIIGHYKRIFIDRLTKLDFGHTAEEIEEKIFKRIKERENYENDSDWIGRSLYIFSFPGIDKRNIIMHCIIGHEMGHLILDELLKNEYFNVRSEQLKKYIIPVWRKYHKDEYSLDLFDQNQMKDVSPISMKYIMATFMNFMNEARLIWKKGLKELASDYIGVLLFGPSFLFSLYFFGVKQNIDDIPKKETNYYPSRRLRLRLVYNYLVEKGFLYSSKIPLQLRSNFDNFIKSIKNTVYNKSDEKNINEDDICSIVYNKLIFPQLKELKTSIDGKINDYVLTEEILFKNIDKIIERIENQIPPNAIENAIDDHELCTIPLILNSSWIYNICYTGNVLVNGKINEDILHFKDLLDRITLKGIEFSFIEGEYNNYLN